MIYKLIAWWALKNYWRVINLKDYTKLPDYNGMPYVSKHLLKRVKKASKIILYKVAECIEAGYSSNDLSLKFEPVIQELWDDVYTIPDSDYLPGWISEGMSHKQLIDVRMTDLSVLMQSLDPESAMIDLLGLLIDDEDSNY